MRPEVIERINKIYEKFPDMYPNIVHDEFGTRHIFIHRLNSTMLSGKAQTVKRYPTSNQLARIWTNPGLEEWLNLYFHPQMQLRVIRPKDSRADIIGHLELFKLPVSQYPTIFTAPECSMVEVYNCAAAFTYDIMKSGKGPSLRIINNQIAKVSHGYDKKPIGELNDDINIIIDQKLTSQYRTIPNMIYYLIDYIKTKI